MVLAKEGDVLSAALSLPASSRAHIVKKLTQSLQEDQLLNEQAWVQEAENRILAFERGEIKAVSGTQMISKLRARNGD